MGNVSSVYGPDGNCTHAVGDITVGGPLAGRGQLDKKRAVPMMS